MEFRLSPQNLKLVLTRVAARQNHLPARLFRSEGLAANREARMPVSKKFPAFGEAGYYKTSRTTRALRLRQRLFEFFEHGAHSLQCRGKGLQVRRPDRRGRLFEF